MMDDEELRSVIAEVLTGALQRPIRSGEFVSRDNEPRWDSLKHMEIVFALEDALGSRFDEADIAAVQNVDDLKRMAEALNAT